ncbi:ABC transporter permease [Actinoplanes lobatus]|uniref:ABC transporter permease n=1 Tax=Actinoplanes lobatus TaxID=113568 RepID=A0A7W7HN41_9ACTN|nr:ABC transporter permease [Actinoplanes lobatus]MBB4753550.1 putative ABC transport system permease protein [Actinoplanes lobatus]GGN84861.1 ABC transporter permease [Actinoplanes lobatus]GIE38086.1 ABC transporter permease [Actinoplanes lobatus]
MLWTALRTLRDRWILFAGSFVALALGVGLVATNALVISAAVRFDPVLPGADRYTGVPILVHAEQELRLPSGNGPGEWIGEAPETRRIPAALTGRIAAVPGVAQVIADRWFTIQLLPAGVNGSGGTPVGRSWSGAALTPYRMVAGTAPQADGDLVVSASLARAAGAQVGSTLRVSTPGGVADGRVTGITEASGVTPEDTVFFTDAAAARLSAAGEQVDALGVQPAAGAATEQVAAGIRDAVATDGVTVATGTARAEGVVADPYRQAREDMVALLAMTAVIAGFVAVFVVASTFAFTVAERRREIALLRLVGAAPQDVRRMVFRESMVVGALGALAGCGIGVVGAGFLAGRLVRNGLAPPGFTAGASGLPLVIAFVVGLLVAALGVISASRRAARVAPVEALRDAAADRRVMTGGRWFAGVLFLVVAAGLVIALRAAGAEAAVPISVVVTEALIIAGTALGPLFLPHLTALLGRPLAWLTPSIGPLVLQNIRTGVRRTVSTGAPVMLTAAIAVSTLGVGATITTSVVDENRAHTTASHVVEAAGGLPGQAATAFAGVPGVTAVTPVIDTELFAVSGDTVWSVGGAGVDLGAVSRTHRLDVVSGSLDGLAADSVVLTREGADMVGWKAGERHTLYFGDGSRTEVAVAAVVVSGGGLPGLLLSRESVAPHVHDPMLTTVYLATGAGTDPSGPITEVAGRYGGTATSTPDWLAAQADAAGRANQVVFSLLIGMALLYSAIAIANTLLMSAGRRRREVALLRVAGGTGRQVLTAILYETLTVIAGALLVGIAVAMTSLIAVTGVLRQTDPGAHVVVPWGAIAVVVVTSLAAGVVAVLIPSRIALAGRALSLVAGRR